VATPLVATEGMISCDVTYDQKLHVSGTIPYFITSNEAHQGVMADRRHSLKRGDRLSKKQRQTTASDWKKSDKLRFMLWAKSDSDIYYNKTSHKAATK
jgi:hypothetical protein